MIREINFRAYTGQGWPHPNWLEPYFLTEAGRRAVFSDQESWGIQLYGVDGTEHLEPYKGRININMTIQGDLRHGILLWYNKSGGGQWIAKYSKGDPAKWQRWLETPQGDQMSLAMFIPFEKAWMAIKEFLEREAALPRTIEWLTEDDLPDWAFRPELAPAP